MPAYVSRILKVRHPQASAKSRSCCIRIARGPPSGSSRFRGLPAPRDDAPSFSKDLFGTSHCDNQEQWINGTAPPVNGRAAQQVMLNQSSNPAGGQGWFAGLHSGTVRVSVPWDIALPDSPNSSLVTQFDPPGSEWASVHFHAL